MPDENLFAGEFSTAVGLARIRRRLLDLTNNNRLLNYRFPKSKALRVIDTPPDGLFERLYVDDGSVRILPIPEPPREDYVRDTRDVLRKPDVRSYAESLGIRTAHELDSATVRSHPRDIQALLYPDDLESVLRKIDSAARTAVEESGTNMLYLAFGYLEWYESEDSDKALLAPLLMLPVALKRGDVDRVTRSFRYTLEHTGDDIQDNITLREKLRQDFRLDLPELSDEDTPESYFAKVAELASGRPRWKVRRQVTVSLLSFGKLLMYLDLDPDRWPEESPLDGHRLVSDLFEGRSEEDGPTGHADDYQIDEEPKALQVPLVFDADSSQHSVLIDALDGYDLVVEGPPGTGKSQTISNLIAATMAAGKRVLFVSEKLAALEVVRHNLDRAHLGQFCLELHSHKTQKKKLLDDIRTRVQAEFRDPRELDGKITELEDKRNRLKRHSHAMGAIKENRLALPVHQVLWRAERHRLALGESASRVGTLEVPGATAADPARLAQLEDAIAQTARHLQSVGDYGPGNPWHGYFPEKLLFDDEAAVGQSLISLKYSAESLANQLDEASEETGLRFPVLRQDVQELCEKAQRAHEAYTGAEAAECLPALRDERLAQAVNALEAKIAFLQAQEPGLAARLADPEAVTEQDADRLRRALVTAERHRQAQIPFPDLLSRADACATVGRQIEEALAFFDSVARAIRYDGPRSMQGIQPLAEVVAAVAQAPMALLPLRQPQWASPGASQVLRRAEGEDAVLREKRREAAEAFHLQTVPPREALLRSLAVLKVETGWLRFFKKRWRQARALYREISRGDPRRRLQVSECVRELEGLVDYLGEVEAFECKPEFRRMAGEHYRGIDTDFSAFAEVAGWYDRLRDALAPFVSAAAGLSVEAVSALPHEVLHWLSCQADAATKHWDGVRAVETSLCELFGPGRPGALCFEEATLLPSLTASCGEAAEDLRTIGQTLGGLFLTPETAVSAVEAVGLVCRVRALRAEVEADEIVRGALGERFAGTATDFGPVRAAIEWCRQVRACGFDPPIADWLLSAEAAERVSLLNQHASRSEEGWQKVEELASSLGKYGVMDWAKWYRGETPPPSLVAARAGEALQALPALIEWADLSRAVAACRSLGLQDLLELVFKDQLAPDELPGAFRFVFYNTIGKAIMRNNPELVQFSGVSHEEVRSRFSALDEEIIRLTGQRCGWQVSKRTVPAGNGRGPVRSHTEKALIDHQLTLTRRHLPIRQLLKRAGAALQALKPCFMMGPLSVAQYLEPGTVSFDLIVMDEASQLRPEEAVGAIARGAQLVVVGDPKQLPPTSFFDRLAGDGGEEDEESESALEGKESILDVCIPLFQPARRLRWHYRSQHESLIAFSNRHFYQERPLIVFPSAHGSEDGLGVRHHFVEGARYEGRRNVSEAVRAADTVIEHFLQRPSESLGVVTMNLQQAELIEEEIDKRLKVYPGAREYLEFWKSKTYPFFIKNLENVQGDERDVILISATYGPGSDGAVRNTFGPINRQMGWRRLNVLFTRARRRIELFTSMRSSDIRLEPGSSSGLKALKAYLEYAETGVLEAPEFSEREPDSDFEIAVAELLRNQGYEVVPQLGVAGFFIDIAVRNPERPGAFLAAIECDGATYHSGLSVRDRDRLRQQVLERLGWKGKIYRVWSTDWFKDPVRQSRRLLEWLGKAREAARAEREAAPHVPGAPPAQAFTWREVAAPPAPEDRRDEDVVVEVGDTVTYCFMDRPDEEKSVQIGDRTNTDVGIIAESTPLAQILLDAAAGDEVQLKTAKAEARWVKVVSIKKRWDDGRAGVAPAPGDDVGPLFRRPARNDGAAVAGGAGARGQGRLTVAPMMDPYERVKQLLRRRGIITSSDAQLETDLEAFEVRPYLQRLVAEGLAVTEGQRRGMRYRWSGRV